MDALFFKRFLILVGRVLVAGFFVLAAFTKLQDPAGFAKSVSVYLMVEPAQAIALAVVVPWVEIVAGFALFIPGIKRGGGLIIYALLFMFIGMHISAMYRGLDVDCGCIGGLEGEGRGSTYVIIRNLVLLVCLLPALVTDFSRRRDRLA